MHIPGVGNHISPPITQCVLCLYRVGFGYNRISRRVSWTRARVVEVIQRRLRRGTLERRQPLFRYGAPPKKPVPTPEERMLKALERRSLKKLKVRLRTYLWKWAKHNLNPYLMPRIVGCSRQQFLHYISSQFYKGMSWDNYGPHWHLDHIIPCSKFNLRLQSEVLKCFHFSNIQPLLVHANKTKSNRVVPTQSELLLNS